MVSFYKTIFWNDQMRPPTFPSLWKRHGGKASAPSGRTRSWKPNGLWKQDETSKTAQSVVYLTSTVLCLLFSQELVDLSLTTCALLYTGLYTQVRYVYIIHCHTTLSPHWRFSGFPHLQISANHLLTVFVSGLPNWTWPPGRCEMLFATHLTISCPLLMLVGSCGKGSVNPSVQLGNAGESVRSFTSFKDHLIFAENALSRRILLRMMNSFLLRWGFVIRPTHARYIMPSPPGITATGENGWCIMWWYRCFLPQI